jgi:hypothetical protein
VEGAFTTGLEQPGIGQSLQVMAQGRGRQIHVALDFACGGATVTRLHHEAEDSQADGMAERAQLFGVAVQFRRHALLLTNWNEPSTTISIILEIATEPVRSALAPVAGAVGFVLRLTSNDAAPHVERDVATGLEELT